MGIFKLGRLLSRPPRKRIVKDIRSLTPHQVQQPSQKPKDAAPLALQRLPCMQRTKNKRLTANRKQLSQATAIATRKANRGAWTEGPNTTSSGGGTTVDSGGTSHSGSRWTSDRLGAIQKVSNGLLKFGPFQRSGG